MISLLLIVVLYPREVGFIATALSLCFLSMRLVVITSERQAVLIKDRVTFRPIKNLQTDNGSEFAPEFERAIARLNIQRYFSRVKTPKDNSEIERFNETLEYE